MKKLTLFLALLTLIVNSYAQDTIFVYQENNMVRIDDLESVPIFMTQGAVTFRLKGSDFILKDGLTKQEYNVGEFNEIYNVDTNGFGSQTLTIDYLTTTFNKLVGDVALQDQTTDPIIVKFNRIDNSTTLAEPTIINDTSIVLTSSTGAGAGDYIIIFSPDQKRFYKGVALSVAVDTVYLDTPLDVAFLTGDFVDITTTNMAVNGQTTNQTFGVRGVSASPIGIAVDITRIIINCETAGAVDLSTFGDIAGGLTNGLVLRKRDGTYFNVFNVKTNGDMAGIAYDWNPALATNPQQGQDGFNLRLTFGGQSKIGVVIRLDAGEDLEFLIRDDLSTITLLEVIAEGHVVEDSFNFLILLLLFAKIKFNESTNRKYSKASRRV